MSRLYNDHGPGLDNDGPFYDYAPPPRFTVHSHDAMIGRLAYEIKTAAADATIHANRLVKLTEQGFAAEAMRNQELSDCMSACMKALADAIEKLERKSRKEAA